jgi:hypothetical protein
LRLLDNIEVVDRHQRANIRQREEIFSMADSKIQKAGVAFAVAQQGTAPVIEVRPHHDTIAEFRGVKLAFELLNGIRPEQAKKIVEMLNENVVGIMVASKDEKAQAAAE